MEKLLGGGDSTWAKAGRRKTDGLGLWKEQQRVRVRMNPVGNDTGFIPWLTGQWSVKLRSD